jgi:hypothetical protein
MLIADENSVHKSAALFAIWKATYQTYTFRLFFYMIIVKKKGDEDAATVRAEIIVVCGSIFAPNTQFFVFVKDHIMLRFLINAFMDINSN